MEIPAGLLEELGCVRPEVQPLSGGLLNRTLRVRDTSHDLVVRVPHADAALLGVDHRAEFAIQRLAAAAGLAPAVVCARPESGLLVTPFIQGHTLSREDLHEVALLRRLGGWLARLHALPVPAGLAAVDTGARAAGFLAGSREGPDAATVSARAERLAVLRAGLDPPERLVPCHHDLHHLNLIDTGRELIALDWEYAGPGDPAADVAACIGYHDLATAQVRALLDGYGPGAPAIAARLPALQEIFACLCQGWALQAGRLGPPAPMAGATCELPRPAPS
jgi:aminoglycoside phosphotransferase (APT) family kinase protein